MADCRGCCQKHGGVICYQNQTLCSDLTSIGPKCQDKKCDVCSEESRLLTYKRKYFPHWTDIDLDCQNTRAEFLISKSLIPVTFKKGKKCTVKSGKWIDFFTGEELYEAADIDIDHVIPLKYAWEIGASQWAREKRKVFANDFENLIVTNLKYNRQKQDKTILEWLPSKKEFACQYLKKWIFVKKKYELPLSSKEEEYIHFSKCDFKF